MRIVQVFRSACAAAGLALAASAAPAALVPPRILQTTDIPFPVTIDARRVATGYAAFIIHVDADGQLVDWLPTSFTAEDFVRAGADALRQWRYRPATLDGQPVGCRTTVAFEFQARGKVVLTEATGLEASFIADIVGRQTTRLLCPARELDRPIEAVSTIAPLHPGTPVAPEAAGRAVVDFIVDERGQPRMPVVVSSSQDLFGESAVDALARWRFAPPTRGGRPVVVRVRQEFVFAGRS